MIFMQISCVNKVFLWILYGTFSSTKSICPLKTSESIEESLFCHFGSSTRKVVPLPISEDFTKMRPLWYSSTIRFAKERPKPHPLFLVVKPGLNTELNWDFAIPFPVSLNSSAMILSVSSMKISMEPLPDMASTAFLHKFSATHSKREATRFTMTGSEGR